MAARAHHGVLARLLLDDQRVGELGVRTEILIYCFKHHPVAPINTSVTTLVSTSMTGTTSAQSFENIALKQLKVGMFLS